MKKLTLALLLIAQNVPAKDLFFEMENVSQAAYEAPSFEKYAAECGEHIDANEFDIVRLKTNRPLINAVVNADIPDADKLTQQFESIFQETLELIKELREDNAEAPITVTTCARSLTIKPRYVGHYQNFEQIAVDWYEYNGGAHGLGASSYYVFDENDKAVSVKDLIKAEHIQDLQSALTQQYLELKGVASVDKYNSVEHCCIEVPEGTNPKDAIQNALLTDNFYFGKEGLIFVYAPYEIASYAEGEIELTIPYAQLQAWVK